MCIQIVMAWFWSSSAELAASVPRTDVVGKNEYFRFGMRDSLAIEASFLQVALILVLCGFTVYLFISTSS